MEKIKTILTVVSVVSIVSYAFAFNAKNGNFSVTDTGLDNNFYTITNNATVLGKRIWYQQNWEGMIKDSHDTSKIRFTYNGKEVVYGIIISPTTGKKWLDRNLGAKRVATSSDDYEAYGDLFQWGRPADGHQLINWTSSTTGTAVNGTTNVLATTDIPGHSNFILSAENGVVDWRSDNNRNRWATASQGPCPAGWHVPTLSEWAAEVSNTVRATSANGTATSGGIKNRNTAYNLLKITIAGFRRSADNATGGQLGHVGLTGWYWCSSDEQRSTDPYSYGNEIHWFATEAAQMSTAPKSAGYCVRCIIN